MIQILFIILAFAVFACTTTEKQSAPTPPAEMGLHEIEAPQGKYSDVLEHWTASDKVYQGISAAYQVTASMVSLDVVEHQVNLDAKQFHWTPEQYREARQKALFEAQSETTFFVAMYTEKDENNNFDKKESVWNIFLDAGGKRVTASSIKRLYENKVSLANKYPYYNLWTRPYIIKFPMATSVVGSGPATLTIAGPIGGSQLKFPSDSK